ncbi:MAG: NmrA family NAD(P)-binding protein [Thermoleophilia bacterium]
MSGEPLQSGRVLVTGAGGAVGRELVAMLVGAGALVRAATHRRDDLVPEEDLDIDRVYLDFAAPDTLLAALQDVEVVYLLTPQVPQAVAQVRAAVAAARTCGVRRIVRHSLCRADTGRDVLSGWHREAEAVVAASGIAYTILRPNSFMQNFVTIYGPSIRARDRFRLPLGSAAMSSVDVRDVAAAATAVLMDEVDADVFTLTGPAALTGAEIAAVLSEVAGRPITYLDESEDAGSPPGDETQRAVSAALRGFGDEMRAGRLAAVTSDVERLTGRPAIGFEQFARDYGWAFVAAGHGGDLPIDEASTKDG